MGSRGENERSTPQSLERLDRILRTGVDVLVGAELQRQVLLGGVGTENGNLVAHLPSVLNRHMTQTTNTLDSYQAPLFDVHLPNGVEDGQPCAKQRRGLSRVHVFGDGNRRLGAKQDVLRVAPIAAGSVVYSIAACLEESAAT